MIASLNYIRANGRPAPSSMIRCDQIGIGEHSGLKVVEKTLPGTSVFEIGPKDVRERKFYFHQWKQKNWQGEYFDHLEEFSITGSVYDRESWKSSLSLLPGEIDSYVTDTIDFGTQGAQQFLRFGWSDNEENSKEVTYNWAAGNSSSLYLSLPKDKEVTLTANMESLPFDRPQVITIKVDYKTIGTWKLSPPWILAQHSIVIKPDGERPDVSVVEFIFSQFRSPEGDPRTLAVAFASITLTY